MSDSRPRLLLPSAGRKVALMRCLEKYFRVYPCGYVPPETASCCLAAMGRFVEQPEGLSDQGYARWLKETCERISIDLVIPVRDGDMWRLNSLRHMFKAEVIMSTAAALHCCNDKLNTYHVLNNPESGVFVPLTVQMASWRELENLFPLFVKHRHGSGSQLAQKVYTPGELGAVLIEHDHEELIVQNFVGGDEYTVDVFCDRAGLIRGISTRKRVSVIEGQMDQGEIVEIPDAISRAVAEITSELTFVGPVNMQFILAPDGAPWLTDVNLRFGGGTPLTIAAGCDFAKGLLQMFRGDPIKIDAPRIGTKAISYIDYVFKEAE